MDQEMMKVEILAWMFNELSLQNLETLQQMAKAMLKRVQNPEEEKRPYPPLND